MAYWLKPLILLIGFGIASFAACFFWLSGTAVFTALACGCLAGILLVFAFLSSTRWQSMVSAWICAALEGETLPKAHRGHPAALKDAWHMLRNLSETSRRLRGAGNREATWSKSLLDSIPFSVAITSADNRVEYLNRSAAKASESSRILQAAKTKEDGARWIEAPMLCSISPFTSQGRRYRLLHWFDSQSLIAEHEVHAADLTLRTIFHEVMNSVTPILTLSASLAEPELLEPEKIRSFAEVIHRRTKSIASLLSGLRELTRIPPPERREVAVSSFLSKVKHACEGLPKQASITIAAIAEPLCMYADPLQLEQVILNLVRNATEAGASEITFHADAVPDGIQITISDNGSGIPDQLLPHLFYPMASKKPGGMGLGLSIAKRFMVNQGGAIRYLGNFQGSTRFLLQVPRSTQ